MAFSIVMSVHPKTDEARIRRVFDQLQLGELDRIDLVQAQSRGNDCLRVFIHYTTTNANADALRARLEDNDIRQKEGEIVAPVKILNNQTRDGRNQYWHIYKTKTPAERMAERVAEQTRMQEATIAFVPRIEM